VISLNIFIFALHIGQIYGGFSLNTTYPHCLQYHNFSLIPEDTVVSVVFMPSFVSALTVFCSYVRNCFSKGRRSGIGCIGVLPSKTSFLT